MNERRGKDVIEDLGAQLREQADEDFGGDTVSRTVIQESLDLLGTMQQDVVSGIEGMVSSVSFDAYGCVQAVLSRKANKKTGDIPDGRWVDVKRLRDLGKDRIMVMPDFNKMDFGAEPGPADKPLP